MSGKCAANSQGQVILGDLRALPLMGASLDAIWACASLMYLPHEDAAARTGENSPEPREWVLLSACRSRPEESPEGPTAYFTCSTALEWVTSALRATPGEFRRRRR